MDVVEEREAGIATIGLKSEDLLGGPHDDAVPTLAGVAIEGEDMRIQQREPRLQRGDGQAGLYGARQRSQARGRRAREFFGEHIDY